MTTKKPNGSADETADERADRSAGLRALDQPPPQPLRLVSFLAPNVFPVYQWIAGYLSARLGREIELLTGDSHDQFEALRPDLALICGLPYILLMRQPVPPVELLAAPVLQGERYQGKPIYFSDVIVRHDAPFRSFEDLRGHSWAYNEMVSQSGYGITRHRLLQMGAVNGFFAQVIQAGWHQRAIQMVLDGNIDATAIDSQVLAIELRDHPEWGERLRLIDVLGPSTIQPVVARADLPAELKQHIRTLLVQMGDDPAAREPLSRGYFERFVPVQDADYDDLRAMLHAAEAAHFLTIR